MTAGELTAEELELLPPLLVMGGPDGFGGPELPGLFRLLSSGLPLQVVLFDEGDLRSAAGDPVLRALARREAFVLSGSPAHPEHLFEGLSAALQFPGPSLVRLYAPSPRRHGFSREQTVERARLAVASRVHPLLRYDPSEEGVFGKRIRLDGNPDPERTWTVAAAGHALTPAHWAVGESRFDDCFSAADDAPSVPIEEWLNLPPEQRGANRPTVPGPNGGRLAVGRSFCSAVSDRAARWKTLQELAGIVTPFTEQVRRGLEAELGEEQRHAVEALRREYEARLAEQEQAQTANHIARLRERLMQLAGYGAARKKPEGEAR
jgi:pyruvate-ferredoxin/flavodoxin oxidoreductase